MVFPSHFASLIVELTVTTVPPVSHVADNLEQSDTLATVDTMQDIEYSNKPLPPDHQERMIDSEMVQLSNIPPITTMSPPLPEEPPKEKKDLEVSVLTPVL